jgi:hypothetical protein
MQQQSSIPPDLPQAAYTEKPLFGSSRRGRRPRVRIRLRYRLLYVGVLALFALILMAKVPQHAFQTTPSASSPVQAGVNSGTSSTTLDPGGRNGGVTLTQGSSATGNVYGGSGPNGACQNTSAGPIATVIKQDFGWNTSFLGPKWQNDTTDQLCNDHWIWSSNVNLRVSDVLSTLRWPPDLLQPQYLTQAALVQPLGKIDPVAAQKQQQQQQAAPAGSCVGLGGIDWGACWSGFWSSASQGISNAMSGFVDWATSFIPMFTTSPALTYKDGTVTNLWKWSVGVADAALLLFLVIGGYNAMMRHTLGANYHSILEFLPRLILAAVAANFSLTFIGSFIELNNALCLGVQGAVATAGAGNLSLPWGSLNIVTLPFYAAIAYLIEGIVGILLVVQALVRIALLDILTILAPIWLLMLGLKQTERFGKLGATAFGATCFLQFLQVVTEGTGSALVSSFGHGSTTPISILVGIATLYLAFKIPGMLYGAMLRPVESGSSAISDMGQRAGAVLLAA